VGLYTSPHLCSFRERISVDGKPIGEEAVAMWTSRLKPAIIDLGATFFEVTTVMALADFAARGAEVAILEVGLGGRLDSTNVVAPMVSGVTTVALDHMKYLGNSIEDITREKAGIAKPGVPFIVGEEDPTLAELLAGEAQAAVEATRVTHGGQAHADVRPVPPGQRWEGPLALAGPHQRRNAAVAAAFLAALPERYRPAAGAVARAFGSTTVPGRYDRRGRWLFDVAHNPAGIGALLAALAAEPPPRPLHALVSILGDKPWAEMLVALDRAVDVGVLTMAPTAASRGWDASWLHEWLADRARPPATARWRLVPDFREALATVQEGAETVLVTGSFHTVGDVMAELGLAPI